MSMRLKTLLFLTVTAFGLIFGCGQHEEEAQYRLGKAIYLEGLGEFEKAERGFHKIRSEYPETKAAKEATIKVAQMKGAMLKWAHRLKEGGKFSKVERLCKQIIAKYPGTQEAKAANELLNYLKERYNRIAYEDLREAYAIAQHYLADYPGGKVDLDNLHYYALKETKGVLIKVLDGRQDQLVMTGEHSLGNRTYTISQDGTVTEVPKK